MADLFIASLASVPELIEKLSHAHYLTRADAARELVNRKVGEALPHLLTLAADPSWFVRYQVTRAAVHLEASPGVAIPLLRRLLDDEEQIVALSAAHSLRQFGETEGLPPVDDSPPELVVFGAIPNVQGQVCQEFVVQEFWFAGELCDGYSNIWTRFSDRWHRLAFDCIVYWEERDEGPTEGPWGGGSEGEYRHRDLAGELSLRGVTLERLTAERTPGGASVGFAFANGLELNFEDHLDETTFSLTQGN